MILTGKNMHVLSTNRGGEEEIMRSATSLPRLDGVNDNPAVGVSTPAMMVRKRETTAFCSISHFENICAYSICFSDGLITFFNLGHSIQCICVSSLLKQKKCMPPQENVYTHVCAKEMYACTKSIYRYMYAQKKCMPPQENVYIHVCTKNFLCLRNNKCIHTCLHKKKCMPAHE